MQQNIMHISLPVAASAALLAWVGLSVAAQPAPAARTHTFPAAQVLMQIGQNAGIIVLTDSTVAGRLALPDAPATAATVEQQIADAVRALPAGTTWAKLYVPAPANGRWSGDAVANYAHALAQMVGTVGRAAHAGMVEILGRDVPADKAGEYISTLNLKLVYLVTNPRAPSMATAGPDMAPNWAQLTPAQREQYIQQQAQRVLALDPTSRLQMLHGLMESQEISPQQALFKAVIGQMSDDERVALKQSFAAEKGLPGAGGGK